MILALNFGILPTPSAMNDISRGKGMERSSDKEKERFLDIAKASCAELRTQTYIGMDIEYIDREVGKQWIVESKEISAMLVGLIKAVGKTK